MAVGMPSTPLMAKICGLRTLETVAAAAHGGATHVGLNHFPRSPRFIAPRDAVRLAQATRDLGMLAVSVVVDPDDALLDDILRSVKPDLIQLHGSESPQRVSDVRARGVGVIKALGVRSRADVEAARAYEAVADVLLFDAKPPVGAAMPGGLGHPFDWTLVAGLACPLPWFLSGGLDPANVGRAAQESGAPGVDVSSGVETAPGVKDTALISAFMAALHNQRSDLAPV
jgi:phosphoribosylanthranilate isomerase